MNSRRTGSGFASGTAAAVEELVAAALRRDSGEVDVQRAALEREQAAGHCGMNPDRIVDLVARAVRELRLEVTDSVAQPLDGLGDVRASLRDGSFVWFEVKAQTKKDRFGDLTQADWVRDETDLLRWLYQSEHEFADRLPAWVAGSLEVDDPRRYFDGWDRDWLWVADMALLSSKSVRLRARIDDKAKLVDFVERKYAVHLTRAGIRIVALSAIAPIASVISGNSVAMQFNYANQSAASIAFSSPGPISHGRVHFTYHVGYPSGVVGRHKMHAVSLGAAPDAIEITG